MTEPTREQLDNLLDRAARHALSTTEADLLCATVRRLADDRDRWQRRYRMAYDRAEIAEAGDQRVRDYANGLKDHSISHGLTAAGCGDRILAALDTPESQ